MLRFFLEQANTAAPDSLHAAPPRLAPCHAPSSVLVPGYTLPARRDIRPAMRGMDAILLRAAVLATALVSLSLPALARGEPSERQKRRRCCPPSGPQRSASLRRSCAAR